MPWADLAYISNVVLQNPNTHCLPCTKNFPETSAMQQFYSIKTSASAGYDLWELAVRFDQKTRLTTATFVCPRCYCHVSTLGGNHNCPVLPGAVYSCIRCTKDVHPPHTFLMSPEMHYYSCYWCKEVIRNTLARQASHGQRCPRRPDTHMMCSCAPQPLLT